jgi:K+-sensing histidine kinase KdpD
MEPTIFNRKWSGYLVAALTVIGLSGALKVAGGGVNAATVSLALLLNVLLIARRWGSLPALLTSVLAMLCLNFFFLPPLGTFTIAAPDNWIALVAFLVTAVTVGQLSARAKRRAEEAEVGKLEIQRLYSELHDAFDRASHAEALRQSEKLKSALLDAVTHDLRTPLTSIKASITTLLDDMRGRVDGEEAVALDSDSKLEMMEVIDEESNRLNRFIGGLIDLARIEAGELHLRRRWGVVDEILSAALLRARPVTRDHRIELDIEKELPAVRVDERAVSEVVYTLIDNAAKYSPKNSTIRITTRRDGEELIRMAVEDQGRGIPVELRERVFDKFFRAIRDGDVPTLEPSGTGMGLAIAKGIVEAHDGRIWIESGVSGGTRVVFTLPIGDKDRVESDTDRVAGNVHN